MSLPLKDCGDNDPNVFPGAQEFCNDLDDDCNGTVDDPYAVDSSVWMFDYDGDGFGDINVKTVRSCKPPTTVPAGCVDVAAGAPSDYCQGKAAEGNPPACPPLPCDLSMWVKETPSTPHTDCKDRPDEYNPKGGYKPELVHPGGTDLCNGFDYGCDGTPNTGCGCSPVGITAACGDVATCNAGTQTCTAGGVWGACDGGDVKPRQDYCPDKDSDGYCDLNACQTGLCPVEVPAGFKLKALCLSFSDCNDTNDAKGAATHPAPADVCNGDGNDYNCNTVANTPGAGDCSCIGTGPNAQSAIACAPAGFIYPSGKNPGDPLAGVCVWGNQSCNPNGTLTACTGGVSGQATENCTPPAPGQPLDGKDYDCNGVSNTVQCACKNGDVQSCENVALCNKGCIQTCQNGQWGPFSIPAQAQIPDCHADVDLDGTCAATTAAKCPPGTWGNDLDQECSTDCAKNDSLARKWRRARNCIGGAVTVDCNDATATARPYFAEDDSLACGAGTTAIWTAVANPGEEKCDFVNHDCFGTNADSGSCDDKVCWPSTTLDVVEWPLSHISGDNVIPNNAAKKVTWSFNFSKTVNLQALHFSSGLLVIEETVTDFTTAQRKNIALPDTGTPVLHPGATIATITGLPTNQPVGQSWAFSTIWTQSPTATTTANLVMDLVSNGQIMNQFCRVQGADNCTAAPSSSMPACLGCELRLSSRCVSVTVNPQ